ncbi:MAG TPA: hypothetical protein VGR02_11790 [Thermoanaerobaculia bacterium]|jgi:hypothetical protein|nr:hypothetical protein [Thermoanaerobaculia bacterium]
MLALLAILLATAMPGANRTAWMHPESFHLVVGMPRAEAVKTLADGGWKPAKGRDPNELVVDYTPTKALTLQFRKERLHSIRFELFGMLPEVQRAFDEQKLLLAKRLGEPRPTRSKSTIIYDGTLPNVMVVIAENQQHGLPMLAVRYFDPR